jgi:hypothetical protein
MYTENKAINRTISFPNKCAKNISSPIWVFCLFSMNKKVYLRLGSCIQLWLNQQNMCRFNEIQSFRTAV